MVILKRKNTFLDNILINNEMNSGACSLIIPEIGGNLLFILNSMTPFFYDGNKIDYLETFCSILSGMEGFKKINNV